MPVNKKRYSLEEAGQGQARLKSGQGLGKVVVENQEFASGCSREGE